MLGKKRSIRVKHKLLEDKIKETNLKGDDESIKSVSEEIEDHGDSDIEQEKNDRLTKSALIQSKDEMRLSLAKKLIQKLGDESEKEEEENSQDALNNKILTKISTEILKKKFFFFGPSATSDFYPHESSYTKLHKGTITSLDISKDDTFVITTSKDARSFIYDINTNKKTLLPQFTQKSLNAVALSLDNKTAFFAGKDKSIYHVDLTSFNVIDKIKAHNEAVTGIVVDTTKPQFYSVGDDRLLKVWSSDSPKSILLQTFYGHTDKINAIRNIPGEVNRIITSGMDNCVNVWKVDSQSFLQFKYNEIFSIDTICPINSNLFATGDNGGNICLWKTDKKKPVRKLLNAHNFEKEFKAQHPFFSGHREDIVDPEVKIGNPILSMDAAMNSDMVITGSRNGEVNFYKVTEEESLPNIEKVSTLNVQGKGCVNAIKLSNKGEFCVVGNGVDGKKGRWDVEYDAKIGLSVVKIYKDK